VAGPCGHVIERKVLREQGNFLTRWLTVGFSRMTLFCGVIKIKWAVHLHVFRNSSLYSSRKDKSRNPNFNYFIQKPNFRFQTFHRPCTYVMLLF
jgi:hypothetical protein